MTFYAALNLRADLNNGNRGFLNTWEIARFATRADRDLFVETNSNKLAKAVTRKEAEGIFAGTFCCVGENVPRGGLFGNTPHSHFYGE